MVYPASEDSWLLASQVPEPFGSKEFLDLGCGTGVVGIAAARKGWRVTCTDIDPRAVEAARENFKKEGLSGRFAAGDLFQPVQGRKFDLIAFNTPYLPTGPEDEKAGDKIAWDGGPDGVEKAVQSVEKAGEYLARGGRLLLLVSSLGNLNRLLMAAEKNRFSVKEVARKKLFFEELRVLCFTRHGNAFEKQLYNRSGRKPSDAKRDSVQ